jgi:CBS domain containing-hemolysin-like protein
MGGQVLIAVTAITAPVVVAAITFWFVAYNRRLVHQERMAMIEKGLVPEALKDLDELRSPASRARTLHSGVITSCIGLALLLGLWTIGFGPWLLGGLIPLAVGIGSIISYVATAGDEENKEV